jgi:hypothetical protein
MFWFFTNKAWLEGFLKGEAFGAYDERQRIIKLLSENQCVCGCEQSNRAGDIALIKGENK